MAQTMRARVLLAGVGVLLAAGFLTGCTPAATPTPVALTISQADAFSILGHSCGGIKIQPFATGFDAATGYPVGAAYLQTRCSAGGRGGSTTTYTAWATVTWDLTASVTSVAKATTAPAVDPAFTATDAHGDRLANTVTATNVAPADCTVGNTTYCTYHASLTVPIPPAPTSVHATQSGDSIAVTWSGEGPAVASATVTATPSGGGAALVSSTVGPGQAATVDGVQPSTTYAVTVTARTVGGTGPVSKAVSVTTHAASVVPAAPGGPTIAWAGSSIQAAWTASVPGDSPVDDYQVAIAQHDPDGPPTTLDAGTSTSTVAPGYDTTLDWSVQVRAHNAAGWGPWTTKVVLPASD